MKIHRTRNEQPISLEYGRDLTSLYPDFVFKEKQLMRRAVVELSLAKPLVTKCGLYVTSIQIWIESRGANNPDYVDHKSHS